LKILKVRVMLKLAGQALGLIGDGRVIGRMQVNGWSIEIRIQFYREHLHFVV
jgi:hypothetical protein